MSLIVAQEEEGCMTKLVNEFTSKNSNSENIITILPELVFSNPFWDGFVQGIQSAESEESNCYQSVSAMLVLIQTADVGFQKFATSTTEKGGTATDAAYMMTLFNVATEAQLVWFNLFADCYLELLMIQVGKITNSSAAGMNFAQTIGITLYETYCEGTGYLVALNQAAAGFTKGCSIGTTDCDKEHTTVGKNLGEVVKENMQWSVPTFKVNEFGVA